MALIELTTTTLLGGILALIAGIVILIWPRALNVAVGLYLLIIGVIQTLSYIA